MDAGVEGEAVEEGAAAGVWERVRVSDAPVRLGGLAGGEGIGLGVEVLVAYESLRRPSDDASKDGLHLLVARRRDGDEPRRAIAVEDEDPVWDERVEVDVQIQRSSEALNRGDAPGPRVGHPQPSRRPSLPGVDGAREQVEQQRGERWAACGEKAHLAGKGARAQEWSR